MRKVQKISSAWIYAEHLTHLAKCSRHGENRELYAQGEMETGDTDLLVCILQILRTTARAMGLDMITQEESSPQRKAGKYLR